ncbi:MAG: slipin family protein [Nitrospinota bacterium]
MIGIGFNPFVPILLIFVLIILLSAIKVMREYERAVVFRLGRFLKAKGPVLFLLFPVIDRMVRVSLRLVTLDVPSQDIITRDNVSVKVNAVLYFRVMDPEKAIIEVEDYLYATSQLAQTTLRSVLGESELDDLLSEREKINHHLQEILDRQTDPWGIKVTNVEIKHVDLPTEMQRAIAKQAEAERERRAKVIHAEGEFQASAQLAEAAGNIAAEPIALQLRFLQTLTEVATENNSTMLFPVPLDLFTPFLRGAARAEAAGSPPASTGGGPSRGEAEPGKSQENQTKDG